MSGLDGLRTNEPYSLEHDELNAERIEALIMDLTRPYSSGHTDTVFSFGLEFGMILALHTPAWATLALAAIRNRIAETRPSHLRDSDRLVHKALANFPMKGRVSGRQN